MALSQRRRALLLRLHQRRTRAREGLVLVEGARAVCEALAAGVDARFAVVSPRVDALERGAELRRLLARRGVPVEEVGDAEIGDVADTDTPQGVLLVCAEPVTGPEAIAEGGRYLVLDAMQDPGNVGTSIRAAVAFALDGVVALDGTADPWGAKAVRASTGLVFRIPVIVTDTEGAVDALGRAGISILVADAAGDAVEPASEGGWALVVGNEGAGVRTGLRARAARTLRIPMPGPAESLNAGVAGAILLFALTREVGGA